MTQKEIKAEKEAMFAQIKQAEERLAEIRKLCNHTSTRRGIFAFRPGSMRHADICNDCGLPVAKQLITVENT